MSIEKNDMTHSQSLSGRTLVYLTNHYPGFTPTEQVFVESELPALLKVFERVIFLPLDRSPENSSYVAPLPPGAEVDWTLADDRVQHGRVLKALTLLHPFVWKTLLSLGRDARNMSDLCEGLTQALNAVAIARAAERFARRRHLTADNSTFYAFWFHHSANGAALAASHRSVPLVVRAHSFDIYDETRFHPRSMRAGLLNSVAKVYSISEHGRNYLAARFPEHADRFEVAPLGSRRFSEPAAVRKTDDSTVRFLTVARMSAEKRLPMIVELLARLAVARPGLTVEWTMIGDGPTRSDVEAAVEKYKVKNFRTNLAGRKENREIHRLMADGETDFYILLSDKEGMPVSIFEAMSYGIPIVATDVGAVAEQVTDDCGMLLPAEIDMEGAVWGLLDYVDFRLRARCAGDAARRRWEENFNAEVLAEQFANRIASVPRG